MTDYDYELFLDELAIQEFIDELDDLSEPIDFIGDDGEELPDTDLYGNHFED